MRPLPINFQGIRSFGGSQNHAFEELCSQLASLEPRKKGDAFYRKGIGADAGVECFMVHRDRSERGWQAKFFFDLSASQLGQLDKSIEQALGKHPRMTHYVVCLPIDLMDQRSGKAKSQLQRWQDWKKKWLGAAAKGKRTLAIELWGASEIVERLGRDNPLYSGRASFWFDEKILTPAWFRERFERARAGLGQRYTPETNVELPIRRAILGFCREPALLDEVEKWAEDIEIGSHDAVRSLKAFGSIPELTRDIESLEQCTSAVMAQLTNLPRDPDYLFPTADVTATLVSLLGASARARRTVWGIKSADKEDRRNYAAVLLGKLSDVAEGALSSLESERWKLVNERRVLVVGDAGVGKSHLFGDAVDYQVGQSRPAILILGGSLIDDEPWSQIRKQLDITESVDWFLGALDAAAQAAGTRAVIFIDAINERHGIKVWSERLAPFLRAIERFPRVAVALSCRTTYLPYIVKDEAARTLPQIQHVGFAGRAAEAARYYLDRRGIVRMAAPNLIPEFENPLFLKTCCDYLDRTRRREIPRGLRGVSEIFRFYSDAVSSAVEATLGLDRRLKIVARALEALARAFDEGERGYLDYDKAHAILDAIIPSDGQFDRSLLARLVSEGILADEPVSGDNDEIVQIVRFSFERYSDHRIAQQLLDRHLDAAAPKSSFASGTPLHTYLTSKTAYERAGVIEAMAIQLPERCGTELPDVIDRTSRNFHVLNDAFLSSILWREQRSFTRRTLDLLQGISRVSGRDEAVHALIAVAGEPDNAFNAYFLHDKLMKLPMPERDAEWSVYLAQSGDDEDSPIETLIVWTAQNGFGPIDEDRAELAAIMLAWLFSTSHRAIRDRATKALAALLALRLTIAAKLVERFQSVDDLYVLERILAAAYGAALQGLTVEGLGALAEAAFRCVFAREIPVVHVLIRDHARGLAELANVRDVLPASVDMEVTRPPYRSPWPIEDVSEAEIKTYVQNYNGHMFRDEIVGSSLEDGDFARYVCDGAVDDFSTLPIALVGRSEIDIYAEWETELAMSNAAARDRLTALIAACDTWRAKQGPYSPMGMLLRFGNTGDKPDEPNPYEVAVDEAEDQFRAALDEAGWQAYCDRARAFVRRDLDWARRRYLWPRAFDTGIARRWICKRAHEFGWTPERFAEFDRYAGAGDRHNHRIERIGKKYQWLAFHELLARLGDNAGFTSWLQRDGIRHFQGPWEVRRRELDPSLIAARGREKTRQSASTWWMPISVNLKSISPQARLDWLKTEDDLVNGPSLIAVTEPRTERAWLVIDEHEGWYQWGVVDGERVIERHTWFTLNCLLVKKEQREQLVALLSDKVFRERGELARLELSSEGYIGEYPWHPLYADINIWAPEPIRDSQPVEVQPTVVEFLAETGGHDYSIEETFRFNVPAPGLIRGMKLHLVNGRDLTYADEAGGVRFFDPSTRESGPGAGLVDRETFLAFLARESLDAVWIIDGEKDVTGGRKRREGFGGSRLFTSLYWMSGNGFERRDFQRRETPTKDQLARFFEEDETAAAADLPTSAKGPKPRSGTRTRRAAVKPITKAGKTAQKKRSGVKKAKPRKKRVSQVPKSAAGRPKGRVRKK